MAIKQIQLWLRLSNNFCVSRVTKQFFDSFKGNEKQKNQKTKIPKNEEKKNASTCNFPRQFGITKIEMAIKKPSIVHAMANCLRSLPRSRSLFLCTSLTQTHGRVYECVCVNCCCYCNFIPSLWVRLSMCMCVCVWESDVLCGFVSVVALTFDETEVTFV